jgi:hypothetical protein
LRKRPRLREEILDLVLERNFHRIQTYGARMSSDVAALYNDLDPQKKAANCFENHQNASDDNVNEDLRECLSELSNIISSIRSSKKDANYPQNHIMLSRNLCQYCYDSERFQSPNARFIVNEAKNIDRLSRIKHVINQVCKILESVITLVRASRYLPVLFHSYRISNIPSFMALPRPINVSKLNIKEMVDRMLDDTSQIYLYEEVITELNEKQTLKSISKDWEVKIHAEVLVAEFFYSHRLKFFANDPFITCSKAACCCCYYHLKNHPGNFIVSASSYNAYIRWKVPDTGSEPDLFEYRNEFLRNTTEAMRKEVLDDMAKRRTRPLQRGGSW